MTSLDRTLVRAFVSLLLASVSAFAQSVPQLVNYQGRVAVGSVNFNGCGQFKFALVNSDGSTTYWSNDGTSNSGSQPTAAVSLTVTKGLYSVLLGDTSLTNMTAIPASVWTNADVRLRVWFDDGTNGSQLFTPDQRLAPNGYLPDATVTTARIADAAVTTAKIAPGVIIAGTLSGYATTAGTASHASNADFAQNSAMANMATSADFANMANTASTASSASYATSAGSLTGNPVLQGNLSVSGSTQLSSLNVSNGASLNSLSVPGTAALGNLTTTRTVGIGTVNPTHAMLDVEATFGAGNSINQQGYLTNTGASSSAGPNSDLAISIYAIGDVHANVYRAFSDERIKNVIGQSDSAADLATMMGLRVTDYTYRDKITQGDRPQKKLIAQQVEKFFPQAVTRTTDVVPDIYQKGAIKDGWIALATNLKQSERVRLIAEKSEGIHEVLEVDVDGQRFRTDFKPEGNEVFVYGREVQDFRVVDYEAIAMLNVSATQQIKKEKDAEIAALKEGNSAVRQRLANLEAKDKEREARLAKLEQLPPAAPRNTATTAAK